MTYIRGLQDLGNTAGRTDVKNPLVFHHLPEVFLQLEREGHADLAQAWTNTRLGPWMVWFLTRGDVPKEDRHRLAVLALHMAGMLTGDIDAQNPRDPLDRLVLATASYLDSDGKGDKEVVRRALRKVGRATAGWDDIDEEEIAVESAVVAAAEACLASDTRKVARHAFEAMDSVLFAVHGDVDFDGFDELSGDAEELVRDLYAHIADAVRTYFPNPPAMPVRK